MHRRMAIGQSINTAIIHHNRFTMIQAEVSISTWGSNWEVGASLPGSLRVGLGDYVSMELDTDKPYIYHEEHIKKFPPKKAKKKKRGRKG